MTDSDLQDAVAATTDGSVCASWLKVLHPLLPEKAYPGDASRHDDRNDGYALTMLRKHLRPKRMKYLADSSPRSG